jgi:orotidine-5'-phosphate decarboxylase
MATVAVTFFSDRLADAVERKQSQLVVGLDPVRERLPDELRGDTGSGLRGVLPRDRRRGGAGGRRGEAPVGVLRGDRPRGVRVFEDVCAYAREAGLLVIADAKRGDIRSTARA